jgi:hypothetical protein
MRPNRKKPIRISPSNLPLAPDGTPSPPRSKRDTPTVRRFRSLLRAYEEDFEVTTEADRVLVQQAATLTLLGERLQAQLVRGEPTDAGTITRLSGQLKRILAITVTAITVTVHLIIRR